MLLDRLGRDGWVALSAKQSSRLSFHLEDKQLFFKTLLNFQHTFLCPWDKPPPRDVLAISCCLKLSFHGKILSSYVRKQRNCSPLISPVVELLWVPHNFLAPSSWTRVQSKPWSLISTFALSVPATRFPAWGLLDVREADRWLLTLGGGAFCWGPLLHTTSTYWVPLLELLSKEFWELWSAGCIMK